MKNNPIVFGRMQIAGVVLGIILAMGFLTLPIGLRSTFAFLISVIIPSLYVGSAIQEGSRNGIVIQIFVAVLFLGIACLGMLKCKVFFSIGLFLHGFWDLFHHTRHAPTPVQRWYPSFCAIVDWTLGTALLFIPLG